MINKIIHFSIHNKFIISIFIVGLIIFGIYEFKKLPIDAVPDITNNQVQIITVSPAYSALDIERLVTFPIEQACSNINGLIELRSFSRFGLSLITVVFDDNVDIYWARQQVAERLQKVQPQIPTEIGKPEIGPITTGLGEIYQYILRPKSGYENKYNITDLRTIQDWLIRRQLLGTKGVADISSFGGKLKQFEISIDLNKLQSYNLSILDIIKAVEQNNQNAGSAYIEKNSTAYFIRTEGLMTSIADIENTLVKQNLNNLPILLKDIAEVKISSAPRYGALLYNNQYEVAGGVVMMLKGENSNTVIEQVKTRIADIQKSLPEGLIIEPFLDRTKMVNNTLNTVKKNLIEGALIVIFVLIIFLGNISFGLLVATIIPLSMIIAVILMNIFKVSGNLMSLGALDFGLIVDGAVIIVEAIIHHLMLQKTALSASQNNNMIYNTSSKMMNSALFGQIIIIVVYIPILSFTGIEGKMFRPMAETVIFALAGAFILSITYIPMMSSWLAKFSKNRQQFSFSEKLMSKIEHGYFMLYKKFFRRAVMGISAIVLVLIVSVWLLLKMGGEFIPTLEEGDFAVETRVLTGSGLSTTIDYCQKASDIILKNFPNEVEKVVAKIGSGEIPTDPMPIEAADLMIILKKKQQWKAAKNFNTLADKMQEKLKEIPGIQTGFQYPVQMRFNELMTGAKQDVVCKIFGENIDSLIKYANITAKYITSIKGAEDLFVEPVFGQPQIVISYKREKLAEFNINISDINKVISAAIAGYSSGMIFENERRFDMVVRLKNSAEKNIQDIKNILIPSINGTQVPLYQVADISVKTDVNQIQRESAKRRIIVGFNVRNTDVESIINQLKDKMKNIKFPSGYSITYGGSFENLESAKQRLMITVPIAFGLIFLFLYFAIKSIRLSLLIYSAIPMASIGGVFFLYFRNIPFSVSAGVGFIALFGIAVLNGIILITEFNTLKQSFSNPIKILFMGIKKRLRPVIMTAAVASLGFLPMFLSTDVGASVQKPLATVVIGGLFSSTLLTLFVLPILYYRFELKKKSIGKTPLSLLLFLLPCFYHGQVTMSYQAVIDSAIKNNLQVKNTKHIDEYYQQLSKTGWNLPKTSIQFNYGQYNSAYQDNSINISQNMAFPGVYVYQKEILKQEWKINQLQNSLLKKEIKNTVSKLFYTIVYLKEKRALLKYADSLYQKASGIINLQYQKGSISELDKSILSLQANNISVQYKESERDLQSLLIMLQMYMNTKSSIDISYQNILLPSDAIDSSLSMQFIAVQIAKENIVLQTQKIKLEQNKLLPDWFFGYHNQSMQGMGSDDIFYPISKRFQYIQTGIEIPVFFNSQNKKINAEKSLLKWEQFNYEILQNQYNYELKKLINDYKFNHKIIELYQKENLLSAANIINTAQQNLEKGNINFIEWLTFINQAITTKSNYLDMVKNQNNIIHQILFINSKN